MQATSPAYRDATARAEQQPQIRVLVDWGRDGASAGDDLDDLTRMVTSVTVDRSLSSDLPDSATLVAGYAAATASVEFASDPLDEARHPAWLFSPYNAASPYRDHDAEGAPVTVELGYRTAEGPELLPALTGQGAELELRVGDSAATLTVLDGAERLRRSVNLPMVVGSDPFVFDQRGGLNSQWLVDFIARQGGFNASPPVRPACALSATLHGSFAAEVGRLVSISHLSDKDGNGVGEGIPATVPYTSGRFALAPTPAPNTLYATQYFLSPLLSQATGSAILFSGWVFVPETPNQLGLPETDWALGDLTGSNIVRLQITVEDGKGIPAVTIERPDSSATTTTISHLEVGQWHYLGAHIRFDTPETAQIEFRTDDISTTELVGLSAQTSPPAMTVAAIQGTAPAEAVQITAETGPPTWDDQFTPSAVLEPGLNELIATPAASASDAWGLLGQIAAAEYGTVHLDEQGVLRFWNRHHWHRHPTAASVQRTLTATESMTGVTVSRLIARICNRVTVPASPLHVAPLGIVWSASGDPLSIPPRGAVEVWADFSPDQVYALDLSGGIIPAGGATVNMRSGYRAARAKDGSGGEIRNLAMAVTAFATTAKIRITNPNAYTAWLVSPRGAGYPTTSDGQPAIALVGRRITAAAPDLDSGTIDPTRSTTLTATSVWQPSIDRYGERLLAVGTSPWRQRVEDAQALADDLLDALSLPVPQVTPLTLVADPALQLGDRVQLVDPTTGLDDPFWIVGLATTFRSDGMTQAVSLRPVARPGQWIMGVPGRSEIGVTTVV